LEPSDKQRETAMTGDIVELIYLVMLQAVEDANADLRDLMEEIRRRNERLCRLRKAAAELRIHREADPASDMELVRSVDDVVADQLKSLSDMSEACRSGFRWRWTANPKPCRRCRTF
jgi:ADP-dependent phosphofructokinase/glucokinase